MKLARLYFVEIVNEQTWRMDRPFERIMVFSIV